MRRTAAVNLRIQQFADYFRQMRLRTQKLVKGNCFVTFTDENREEPDPPVAKETAVTWYALTIVGTQDETTYCNSGSESGGWSDDFHRFIQYSFDRSTFCIDLPNNTLRHHEAKQLFCHRDGFFYARNRPDLAWVRANWRNILDFDPVQKVYLYKDEDNAAEDMAYILFDLWQFPIEMRLYVNAAAFHSRHRFNDKPLE